MQMQTISARLPSEDLAWLMTLDVPGAVSPSDKLRALVAQMRRQSEGTLDYARSLAWLREMLTPFVNALRAIEHRHQTHSEALTLVAEWLPQVMATLLSERTLAAEDRKRATEIEDIVVRRCFQFLASLMRLAVTRDAACYDPAVIDRHIKGVLEIAGIVAQSRKLREESHG